MATVDPFARTESLDAPTLDALVQRFEARGRHPQFAAMLQQYLDAMHIGDAAAVLDVGCGTGLVARAIARRPGFRGRVIGVDRSSYLISAAERLAREEGIGDRAEFRAADASDVDLADGTLDAVVAHTLLSHGDDPLALLREAARVVRHGGAIGVFDGDYASLTFDHADSVKAKKYDDAVMNALVTTPRVMRRMPKLLRAAGLDLVAFFSWVLAESRPGEPGRRPSRCTGS